MESSPSFRRKAGALARLALSVFAFGATFWLASGAIQKRLPVPPVEVIGAKVDRLRNSPGKYDTLLLGTSRTYHQIVPAEFDAFLHQQGLPSATFNAAADGMFPPEDGYFFDRLRELPLRGVRWVVVEVNPISTAIESWRRESLRAVYWHDAASTALVLREAASQLCLPNRPGGWSRRASLLQDAAQHLRLFLRQRANLGRAEPRLLLSAPSARWSGQDEFLGAARDGFLTVNYPPLAGETLALYERQVAARRIRPAVATRGTAASQAALTRLLSAIRETGAQPVLLIPPTLGPVKFVPAASGSPPILDLCDLEKFPALYLPENRMNGEHLNTAGAHLYTRAVAAAFARLREESASPTHR